MFKNQRFKDSQGNESQSYFERAGNSLCHKSTKGLEELACRYARDTTYTKAVEAVIDVSGEQQLSDQCIHQMVADRAKQVSEEWAVQARLTLETAEMPEINPTVDLYDEEIDEVCLTVDDILVKEQKLCRDHIPKEKRHFIPTTLVLLEKKNHKFSYLLGGVDEASETQVGVSEMITSSLIKEYGSDSQPINIVAINDGARDIRSLLSFTFGMIVTVILDWYHLKKKVNEHMSMFGLPIEEKKEMIKEVLHCLWRGHIDEAMRIIEQKEVSSERKIRKQNLLEYLEKHRSEIINYKKRKKLGKYIGSGRVESGVNSIIGRRQKRNGMSWSKSGSKSLGILKAVQLNEQWHELFFSQRKAA
ncbi:conserved hypothetical protein [Desulfamplus magnetovallimortis]|uniref:Transposase n=1 Tax=Desulfamplus magnetovallimortis TaxID=1246637 RepID=A0A1W1HEZ1_9BACT|nr:hypothetical protein [Desulfamplus magnetovallimortis]SLM31071.1 conserved hypothetical protein [Desulfamplus magnetovallimortis]